jgi:hypothetical protein
VNGCTTLPANREVKDIWEELGQHTGRVVLLASGDGSAYQFTGKPSSSNFNVNVSDTTVVISKMVGTPRKQQAYREQGEPG